LVRSYLQTNSYVNKVSAHIVKKVADKLVSMQREDKEAYAKVWDDIKTFVEYACMRDDKFWSRTKDVLLLKQNDGTHVTVQEYLDAAKEKHENTVYYTTDPSLQAQYVAMYEAEGISVVCFDSLLDTQFAALIESKMSGVKFVRVDADLASVLKNEGSANENEELRTLFRAVSGNEQLNVRFEALKDADIPTILNVSEESRRMEDMMRMYRMSGEDAMPPFPTDTTLIVNTTSPLVEKVAAMQTADAEKAKGFASYLYRLAVLSQRRFNAEEMQEFLKDSYRILTELAK